MEKRTIFVTGIGTDVGKTIASAILTEHLQADYWKPIQAGDLENSDTIKIKKLISNKKTLFHASSHALKTPASPHYAAFLDEIEIDVNQINVPKTENHLVIEGAGGIFVPLNNQETILDIIPKNADIVIVSRHYLGSINHTLLTVEALKQAKKNILGIIFNGNDISKSEEIILQKTGLTKLFHINEEPYFDQNVISEYADNLDLTKIM
jgi:dethiobiotin synthetase